MGMFSFFKPKSTRRREQEIAEFTNYLVDKGMKPEAAQKAAKSFWSKHHKKLTEVVS